MELQEPLLIMVDLRTHKRFCCDGFSFRRERSTFKHSNLTFQTCSAVSSEYTFFTVSAGGINELGTHELSRQSKSVYSLSTIVRSRYLSFLWSSCDEYLIPRGWECPSFETWWHWITRIVRRDQILGTNERHNVVAGSSIKFVSFFCSELVPWRKGRSKVCRFVWRSCNDSWMRHFELDCPRQQHSTGSKA